MEIARFDDLLDAARAQPEPQRLLFVFAGAELPEDSTPEQRARFEAGQGGALVPQMCVDKALDELQGFEALASEAATMGPPWQIVFVAALSGRGGRVPASSDAEQALNHMVEAIRRGQHQAFIPFDRQGLPVAFG